MAYKNGVKYSETTKSRREATQVKYLHVSTPAVRQVMQLPVDEDGALAEANAEPVVLYDFQKSHGTTRILGRNAAKRILNRTRM